MEYRGSIGRRLRAVGYVVLVTMAAMVLAPAPSFADWREDAKEAALKYAEDKTNELVKEQAKKAVFALYSKLYKSGASKTLTRALAEVAISAPDLNELANETAEAYGSGDPDKIREASEKVAVKFGEQISRLASNPETRGTLGSIIGKADAVRDISTMLGNVAAGTNEGRREAAKYVGEVLIGLTPGAQVVGFYQGAYGAMKYANDEYVDSKIEDLYKSYKNGDAKTRELILDQLRAGTGGYGYVIENRRKELEEEKIAGIGDAAKAASERVKEHLTKTTDDEVIRNIIASFDGRIDKERQDAALKTEREKAQKEAEAILEKLNDVASQRHGSDWHKTRTYDLDKFTSTVRNAVKADGVLDPNNPVHVKKMSKALSTAMVHGKDSKEYKTLLDELKNIKDRLIEQNKNANCTGDSEALAARLWRKGRQLVAEKKIAAAIPVLKQSLELCEEEERAAQLAELTKLAKAPAAREFDGSYSGGTTFTPRDRKEPPTLTGSITLRIKDDVVTGTVSSRESGWDGHPDVVRTADISGRVSPEGRITATIKGRSTQAYKSTVDPGEPAGPVRATKAMRDVIINIAMNYSFEGSFTGEIGDGQGAGNFSAAASAMSKGSKPRPNHVVGTWKAIRK